MSHTTSLTNVSSLEGYRLWSGVFDDSLTPMQSVEQRFLRPLLPSDRDLNVLDLGCGTGRWLMHMASAGFAALTGVDTSPDMIALAARKLGPAARLILADCEALPLPASSADVVLCSFAISHVEDLDRFVGEVARIARPGASVFVTDLHSQTVALLGWRRGFKVDGIHMDIKMEPRPLDTIASSFEEAGLPNIARLELPFGEPERGVYERAGKGHVFDAACRYPAIYIMQFTKPTARSRKMSKPEQPREVRAIAGARIALDASESARADIGMHHGRIETLGNPRRAGRSSSTIDLAGLLVMPGLVNSHDHLEFALFPRLGAGNYRNYIEWAQDIYRPDASPVREHLAVSKTTRLFWGAIRNLLSGVTTVCHHNPYARSVFGKDFPVRVVRNFGWAHSLAMDQATMRKHRNTPRHHPFIMHLGEGVDVTSAAEIFDLQHAGGIDDRTVLVHGLGLDAEGLELLTSSQAALVWCPSSNVFLFGKTHAWEAIKTLPRVALGSDSPLTSTGDLLDEIRFAHSEIGVPAQKLYEQVTRHAADILHLRSGEGGLRIGAFADFFAVRDRGLSPAETLVATTWRDVEFVLLNGCVQLASRSIYEQLPPALARGLHELNIDGETRWIRAPVGRLFRDAASALGGEVMLGGRRVGHERSS